MAETKNQQAKVDEVKTVGADAAKGPDEATLQDPKAATEDQKVNDETASVDGDVDKGDADAFHLYDKDDADEDEVAEVRTSDWDDPNRSWTVQSVQEDADDKKVVGKNGENEGTPAPYVVAEGAPGQVFSKSQLPDAEVMKANGINVPQFFSGLPVKSKS